jgi:hypothetical protein
LAKKRGALNNAGQTVQSNCHGKIFMVRIEIQAEQNAS